MNEEIQKLLETHNLTLASILKRFVAFVIDDFLMSAVFVIIIWNDFQKAVSTVEMINIMDSYMLMYLLLKVMYQTFFVYMYGATLGKMAMKIQIIEIKTLQKPSLPVAFNRAVFRIVSEMIFYLGFLWGVLNPTKQTWHDLTAKTLVVNA